MISRGLEILRFGLIRACIVMCSNKPALSFGLIVRSSCSTVTPLKSINLVPVEEWRMCSLHTDITWSHYNNVKKSFNHKLAAYQKQRPNNHCQNNLGIHFSRSCNWHSVTDTWGRRVKLHKSNFSHDFLN